MSVLGLGTMGFGGAVNQGWVGTTELDGARRQIELALDAGVNLIDTASSYSQGRSEELLGEALGRDRERVLLSTKVHGRVGDGVNDVGQSRYHIIRTCETSLRRLRTDRIDILHVHGFDACTPLDESLRALDSLVAQGKVRYVACSNYAAWQLMKALGVSERHNLERYSAVQAYYSLVARELEWDILPLCADQGVGVLVWSPLAGGFLSGKFTRDGAAAEGTRRGYVGDLGVGTIDPERGFAIVDALREIADARGVTPAQVALNWPLTRPTVTSVLIGARTEAQLRDNLAAAGWSLTPAETARLDEVSAVALPYPHWYQRQFTAERYSRDGAPAGAFDYRFADDDG